MESARRLNLAEVLVAAPERAARIAVREPSRAWTYGELAHHVRCLAGGLASLGVKSGDRVAVLMPDGLEAVCSILGAVWMGAVAVPLSELARPNDVRALIRDAGAVVVIVHASLEPVIDEVRAEMDSLKEVVVVGRPRGDDKSFEALLASPPMPPAPTHAGDPALLLYSTGPSARPRAVPHSHATPLSAFDGYARGVLGVGPGDRVFCLVRLATAFGLGSGLVFPLAAGAEAILLPEQARSKVVFDVLKAAEPTILVATPSVYGQLLVDATPEVSFRSLRVLISGTESLPARLSDRITRRFGVELLGGYGLTEAFHFVIASGPGQARPGSAGKPLAGFEARVVGDDGTPLGEHEIGTLELRGPTVASRYWNAEDDTNHSFRAGWLRTADRFMRDADGFYFHCGRTDDLFKCGGKWVSPGEVERALVGHPAVWECAVIGVEDDTGLTKPLAFVVPNVGHAPGLLLERELIAHVKRELAPYKYPRWVEFVEQLPKGAHGKVLRYKLTWKPRRRTTTTSGPFYPE
jgi:benzoate-CoA ligase